MDVKRNARYMDKVNQLGPDECWTWKGARNENGYGMFRGEGEQLAHRHGYKMHFGSIPEGLSVCHTCDNPACQNPNHWFLGTHQDNMDDRTAKGRGGYRPSPGEKNGQSRLTQQDIEHIRSAYIGGKTQSAIAVEFGITQQTVSKLVNAKRWKHLDGMTSVADPMRRTRGEGHHNAKISASDASDIRSKYAAGGVSQQDLGRAYGISQNTVSVIVRGKGWVR